MRLILFFLQVTLCAYSALAAPTFGAEFNFSNDALRRSERASYVVSAESEEAQAKMADAVAAACTECRIEVVENKFHYQTFKVTYPDGFYFIIATDPTVVEVQTKPSTAKEIEAHRDVIQKHIFETARAVGLQPSSQVQGPQWAANHIHVGVLSTLGTDPKKSLRLFRNFLVDFTNHSELPQGIFSNDNNNAPALLMYPDSVLQKFEQLINDVDTGKVKTVEELAERLRLEVYSHHPLESKRNSMSADKYQAFNVNRIDNYFEKDEQTFELRAMRAQDNADDFVRLTKLISKRLDLLATKPNVKLETNLKGRWLTEREKGAAFYNYVNQTGLDFEAYERYLTPTQRESLPANWRSLRGQCRRAFQ